jgi:glutathione synthase/RimK-type ligase-like ATP-grasp enzyme
VPPSLFTNGLDALRAFATRHGSVVVKPSGGGRAFTNTLDLTDSARLERLRTCPTYFQQFFEGTNVRVHVVGSQLFSTEIHSQEIDYRRGATEMQRITVPPAIEAKCLNVTQTLGLLLEGLDLIRTGAATGTFWRRTLRQRSPFIPTTSRSVRLSPICS